MIYMFLGIDFSIVNSKVNSLIDELNIENIIRYEYGEITLRDIIEEVNYIDLFNEKKLIIVSNFSLKKLDEIEEKIFMKYIENMNENVIIFKCVDESIDERKSLTKLLKSKCNVQVLKKLDYKDLHAYVTNMFKEKKIEASYNQIKKILELCDNNPDFTINEVNKLFLYKIGDNKLSDKDIMDVVTRNTEKEIFRFTESVIKKDIASSMDSYKILISCNYDPVMIVDSLAKQLRFLIQVKDLRGTRSEDELARFIGVNKYEQVADLLHKLSDMDVDVKVNGLDRFELMEKFIIEL